MTAPSPWDDALLAAALAAVDPLGLGGVHVKAGAGPVRGRWLDRFYDLLLPGTPRRRIAAGMADGRLYGGLDIGATLACGRPVMEKGVLASADNGFVVVAMAERLTPGSAALIGMAMDEGAVRIEREGISARLPARFALVALDEGADETEALPASLADRLGLRITLDGIGWREADMPAALPDIADARRRLAGLEVDTGLLEALCGLALSLGHMSMRVPAQLARAARAAAALRGADKVDLSDAATAIRLVLGLAPEAPAEDADQHPENPSEAAGDEPRAADPETSVAMDDLLLEAVEASVPRHVLDRLRRDASRVRHSASGKAGATIDKGLHGRVVGSAEKPPVPNARLDVLATLRQAARWQGIRNRDALARGETPSGRPLVRKEDFRYARRREHAATTALFVVDASGSAALERLAETKGAIELLLAECYVRRDSVGLIAFRGGGAEVLLEPTRSLVRAKRCLSALPGGGATPLASGIVSAMTMAGGCARRGHEVVTVFLTDGRGNVGLDGKPGREHAEADTAHAARLFRGGGFRSILFDTGQRAQPRAEALARDLGAEYLPLPRGGSHALSREIGARMAGGGHG